MPSPLPADDAVTSLARLGRRVRWLALFYLLVLLLGLGASTLVWPGPLARHPALAGLALAPGALGAEGRLVAFAALAVPVLPMLVAIRQALALCDLMIARRLFTADAPPRLRRMGIALVAAGALHPVGGALVALAVSRFTGNGVPQLTLALSADDVGVAVIGAVLIAVAAASREAVRLADENAGFL
jgi:hypothetical protein